MNRASVLMLVAVLLYTISNACIKMLSAIPFMEVVYIRSGLVLLFILFLGWVLKINLLHGNKKVLMLRGAFGALSLMISCYSMPKLPLATISVIGYMAPIFTVLLAVIFLKEVISLWQGLIFLLAFGGIFLIKGFSFNVPWMPFLMHLLAVFFSACGYITIRKSHENEKALLFVFYTSLISFIVAQIWIVHTSITFNYSEKQWVFIILVSLLTFIATWLMSKAFQLSNATKMSNLNYTSVVYAVVFGYLFFEETITLFMALGIMLVIGCVVVNHLWFQKKERTLMQIKEEGV